MNSAAVPQDKRASLDLDAARFQASIFQPFDIVTQSMKVLLILRVLLVYAKVLPELGVDFMRAWVDGEGRVIFLTVPQRHQALHA